MNAAPDFQQDSSVADSPVVKIAIIYEDFASGVRAKHFAERLADSLGCACPLSESLWRSELLDCPPIASAAARSAADAEYIIVSLSGNNVLPFAFRQWIESQLDSAAERGAWVIALLGSGRATEHVVNGNRHYLRAACAAKGVEFFSLSAMPASMAPSHEEEDEFEAGLPGPRRAPALLCA